MMAASRSANGVQGSGLSSYPAYKPSNVEWLGDVPAHWEIRRLKNWLGINEAVLPETTDPEFEFRYLEIGAVGTGLLVNQPATIRFGGAPSRARRILRTGDTIVSTVRTYLKATWFAGAVKDDLVCSTGFAVLTPRHQVFPKFVSYITQSNAFTDRVTASSVGTAYPAIAESQLGSFHVLIPPLPEQQAIVRYLDYVDRRIRRYVAAKRRLIGLLEEERQAVVNRAVTRGLDPNVRLKPSGVEWLGDVPEHWEVRRAKFLYREADERSTTGTEELMSVSHITGVTPRKKSVTMFMAESNTGYKLCRPGDIVINTMWAFMAALGVARQIGLVSPSYGVYRPLSHEPMNHTYVDTLLRNEAYRANYTTRSTGITSSRLRLYAESFLDIPFLCPPIAEQDAIVEQMDIATADIDAQITRARCQVELVEEYRTRLIADVVTGKLDVREATAQLPDEAENDVPLGESGPQENGLAKGPYDAEKEPAIAEEVTT
jgi:type I restriction enzyme S subunit